MKNNWRRRLLLGVLVLFTVGLWKNAPGQHTADKCGYDEAAATALQKLLGSNWGYGYIDLLSDLQRWAESPYVQIDSIGTSVEGRVLWQLTITQEQLAKSRAKHTIFIHARTHPAEVQAFWVTNAIINWLLSDVEWARRLREQCVFYIVPMYNPDGVELGYARQNANGVDLESNWNADTPEPEVQALRARFLELMQSPQPIEVALNMHSSYRCTRYFVYHHENGTSKAFTQLEKQFIGDVRQYFPPIENWDYFISWTNGTPLVYPESWFWVNYQEAVMALTYEDMNCDAAGDYDSTALALLRGIADFLNLDVTQIAASLPTTYPLPVAFKATYPNPVYRNENVQVSYRLSRAVPVTLTVLDVLGRQIQQINLGLQASGNHRVTLPVSGWRKGIYFLRLQGGNASVVRKITIVP